MFQATWADILVSGHVGQVPTVGPFGQPWVAQHNRCWGGGNISGGPTQLESHTRPVTPKEPCYGSEPVCVQFYVWT